MPRQKAYWFLLHAGTFKSKKSAEILASRDKRFRMELGYKRGTRIRKVGGGYVVESRRMAPPKGAVWDDKKRKWVKP